MSLLFDNSFTNSPQAGIRPLQTLVFQFSTGEGVEVGYNQDHSFQRVSYRPDIKKMTDGATIVAYHGKDRLIHQDSYLGDGMYFNLYLCVIWAMLHQSLLYRNRPAGLSGPIKTIS